MILINETPLERLQFPDGTYFLRSSDKSSSVRITWQYEKEEELFQLYCVTRHLQQSSSRSIVLFLPYLPNARMDRVKNDDEIFTLKYFCEMINSLAFDSVEVLDAHSPVSLALLDRVKALSPKPYIDAAIRQIQTDDPDLILYFPDEGACKRYISMYPNTPYCYGIKNRYWETGKIVGLDIITHHIDLEGRTILMIDDICSYGGTLYYSAETLLNWNVRHLYSFTTHTENSLLSDHSHYFKLLQNGVVLRHFTTSSIYRGNLPFIEVIEPPRENNLFYEK